MKKLFNVDQLSVMILAGAIMALAWGCKREAVNVSQTLADGIYRVTDRVIEDVTDEFTEKAISDYINIYDDYDDIDFLANHVTSMMTLTDGWTVTTSNGTYIVTNGVIEEVVEEETYVTATNMPDASEPMVSTNLARVEDGYMFDGINDYLEIHTDIYLEGYYTLANLENMIKRWKKYEKENGRAQ